MKPSDSSRRTMVCDGWTESPRCEAGWLRPRPDSAGLVRRRLAMGCACVLLVLAAAVPLPGESRADPVVGNGAGSAAGPTVFCIRVTDIQRVTPFTNRFRFQLEFLNWTDMDVFEITFVYQRGSAGPNPNNPSFDIPNIIGVSTSPAGRGDSPAHHSGRGRSDIPGFDNDWSSDLMNPPGFGAFPRGIWTGGTPIPAVDLVSAGSNGNSLIPGTGLDSIAPNPDSAVDGGPLPYTGGGAGQPVPDGSGNVLDGLELTVDNFKVGSTLGLNWRFRDASSNNIINSYAFGTMNLQRVPVPTTSFASGLFRSVNMINTGFRRGVSFFDTVWSVPNPAEFVIELGAGITAPFLDPSQNTSGEVVNVSLRPEMVIEADHGGSSDPTIQGWTEITGSGVTQSPVSNDLGSGIDAWAVDDDSAAPGSPVGYTITPSDSQIQAANLSGWTLTARLRVVDANDPVGSSPSVSYADGSTRWEMNFGTQADGDPIVELVDGTPSGPTFVLEGAGFGHHTYTLIYNPVSQTVDLFVNGLKSISDFSGPSTAAKEIFWGAGADSEVGHGNFSVVRFEIGTIAIPIPAMSRWAMVALGCAFLGAGFSIVRRS